jgi:Tfp pilus assembly protein PilZ
MESVTANVSVAGAFIRCMKPPKPNEAVEVIVNIPDINRPFKIIGEVAWLNINGSDDEITPYGIGVRFKNIY